MDYIVGLTNKRDVEQLTTPTSAKLAESLQEAGAPMYSKAPPPQEEDDQVSNPFTPIYHFSLTQNNEWYSPL